MLTHDQIPREGKNVQIWSTSSKIEYLNKKGVFLPIVVVDLELGR